MYLFNQQFFRSNVFMRNFGRIAGNVPRLRAVAAIYRFVVKICKFEFIDYFLVKNETSHCAKHLCKSSSFEYSKKL